MASATEIRYEHYRQLFLHAQQARNQIRSGIGTPVAATAFTVFNLGTVAQHFDATRWAEPASLVIAMLAALAVLAVLAAAYNAVMVEYHFVHVEPPDLDELLRIEQAARRRQAPRDGDEDPAVEELRKTLIGSYYAGYITLLIGNARSASYRTRSLRLVLLALSCTVLAFLFLPVHLARTAAGAGGG